MCDCLSRTNEKLRAKGCYLPSTWRGGPRVVISTYLDKPRGKHGDEVSSYRLYASFCPFCGRKYPEDDPRSIIEENDKYR